MTCPRCGAPMRIEEARVSRDGGKTWLTRRIFRCRSAAIIKPCPTRFEDVALDPGRGAPATTAPAPATNGKRKQRHVGQREASQLAASEDATLDQAAPTNNQMAKKEWRPS